MPAASNNLRQLAYVVESTFGTTPGTPTTVLLDHTNFTGNFVPQQLDDASITPLRQVTFSRRGNLGTEGSIDVNLAGDQYDALLEAVLMGTWTTNVLKVGNTKRSFAIEEGFTDLGQYQVWNGVTFNTLSLSVTTEELVTASFGFLGTTCTTLSGTSIDASPTAVTTRDRFFHADGSITEGGSVVAYITALTMELTNNAVGNYALGNAAYRAITPGKVGVSGTLTALFEDVSLYNKFKNATDSSILLNLAAGTPSETYAIKIPKVKYTTGAFTRAETGPVLVELGFTGIYDTTDATSLMITRSA